MLPGMPAKRKRVLSKALVGLMGMALLVLFFSYESWKTYPNAMSQFWAALAGLLGGALVIVGFAYWRYHLHSDFVKK
jgi:hypothetical protein